MTENISRQRILDKGEMLSVLKDIGKFTDKSEFQKMLKELRGLPTADERFQFVKDVIIVKEEQEKRGIFAPPEILIQRSYFTDNRPTLFCVVK